VSVLPFVIAGQPGPAFGRRGRKLDPAIYLFRKMDARIKSAHDDLVIPSKRETL
jgi:hypothetical protein